MQTLVVNSNNFTPCSLHLCHSPVPQYNQPSEGDTLLLYGGHKHNKWTSKLQNTGVYTVYTYIDQEILLLVQVHNNAKDGG